MHQQVYINLPIENVERSKSFFIQLGYDFDAAYSNEKSVCFMVGENIFIILLDNEYFQTFTTKSITDNHHASESIVGLSCESRKEVNEIINKAKMAGAVSFLETKDNSFMYERGFYDLDGHAWKFVYLKKT